MPGVLVYTGGDKIHTKHVALLPCVYQNVDEITLHCIVGASTMFRAVSKFCKAFSSSVEGIGFWCEVMLANLHNDEYCEHRYTNNGYYAYTIEPVGVNCYNIQLTFKQFNTPPVKLK